MVVYKLALPTEAQIHDVFHVSLLKKKEGLISNTTTVTLPRVSTNASLLPEPKFILDHRVIQKEKYRLKTKILFQLK
jgi:hypothetical protein